MGVELSKPRDLRFCLALLTLLCVVGAATHRINTVLDGRSLDSSEPWNVGPLPDGKALRVLALGFDRLIADLYWLRTVNYIGHEEVTKAGYPEVARLGELVTDIDPYFLTAYSVMNSTLTLLNHDPNAAMALLDKGIRHNSWWKLHFLQGFNHFFEKGDYAKAAEQMRLASMKGGPPYLPLLAARLYASAGSPETALAFLKARSKEANSDLYRERLAKRMRDLWIQRDLQRIDAAIEAYSAAHGEVPPDVATLVAAGLLEFEPRDPLGGEYRVENGAAVADIEHDALRVHLNK